MSRVQLPGVAGRHAISAIAPRSPKRRALLTSTALTGAFIAVIAGHPHSALAACAGENTASVLCDASNPSGGSLNTSFAGASAITINAGAGITGFAAAFVSGGDLTFIHNDPAGIGIGGASNGIELAAFNGAINYTGAGNVSGANAAISINLTNGPVSITQSSGVLSGLIGIRFDSAFPPTNVVIDTTGSQINAAFAGIFAQLFQSTADTNVDITTGAISGGTNSIRVDLGFSSFTGKNISVHTKGAVTGDVFLRNYGLGSMSFIADEVVNGNIAANNTQNNNNTAAVTVVLKKDSTGGISAMGRGLTTIATRSIGGVSARGGSGSTMTVDGDVGAGGVSAIFSGTGTAVAINGAVTAVSDTRGQAGSNSFNGVSASANNIYVKGPINASVFGDNNVTAGGVGASSSSGSITTDGAVTTTAAGNRVVATGVSVSGSGSGVTETRLNGPITLSSTAIDPTSTATGLSAIVASGTHNVTSHGAIAVTATGSPATGILSTVLAPSQSGILNVVANGNVSATSDGTAMGVSIVRGTQFLAGGMADVSVTTKGTITATSTGGGAIGMNYGFANTAANARTLTFRAEGDVIATGLAGTFGIKTAANHAGDVTVEVLGKVQSSGGGIDASRTVSGNSFVTTGANASVTGTTGVTTTGGTTTLTHAGKITGTNGTAIKFGGTNDVLTLIPGYGITGNVIGNASTLQLGGTAAAAFDLTKLGSGVQYSGFGSFNILGGSNWTLSGDSSFAGAINVASSTSINGALPNTNVTVDAGVTLGGNATFGNLTVNGGTLSPGNSIGAITVNGNLVLGAGSIYKVEVDGALSDKTTVTGSATLDGKVVVTPLSRLTSKTTYTILSASSVTGTFSGGAELLMVNNLARNPVLSYAGGNVLLTLDPGLLSPILPAFATANQKNVATAIDNGLLAGRDLPPGFDGLFNLTPTGLTSALGQLSGETHASTAGALVDESSFVRAAVLGRLRQASYGGDAGMAALSSGGPQTAFAEEAIETALAYGKSPIVTKAPLKAPSATGDVAFWAQGFGSWGRFNGDGNASTLRRDLVGILTGFDMRIGAFGGSRIGFAAGYTGSQNNTDGRGSSSVETGHIAAYSGTSFGHWNLRAGGSYAFHSIDTTRTIAFPGFFDRTFGRYDGGTGQAFGELGYGTAFGGIAVEPFAGAAWVHLDTDATRERGGAAALSVAANSFKATYSTLGVRAASMVPIGANMILIPRASLAWQHAYGDVTPASTLAFVATGASFVTSGVPIARDAVLAEAALDLAIGRNTTLGISYSGQIASNVADHGAKGKFVWKF